MKAHDLAKKLLDLPNLPVYFGYEEKQIEDAVHDAPDKELDRPEHITLWERLD